MAFFRHSPDVLDRFHAYPKFSSLSAYLTLPGTLIDAEESEFSHFMFTDEESFTFIFVEGMVDSYDTVLLSAHGVFYVPLKKADMIPNNRRRLLPLIRPKGKRPVSPTFSIKGVEKKTRVFADGKYFQGGLWFDKQHATFVETGWNQTEREQKAYFMRRNPYGPITQRIEPRERFLNRDRELGVDECLYKHWQAEKHRSASPSLYLSSASCLVLTSMQLGLEGFQKKGWSLARSWSRTTMMKRRFGMKTGKLSMKRAAHERICMSAHCFVLILVLLCPISSF